MNISFGRFSHSLAAGKYIVESGRGFYQQFTKINEKNDQ